MIAALLLSAIALVLVWFLPAPVCGIALLLFPPAVWLIRGGGERWLARRDRARASAAPEHVHGAWCHPSADGCPDRPGA